MSCCVNLGFRRQQTDNVCDCCFDIWQSGTRSLYPLTAANANNRIASNSLDQTPAYSLVPVLPDPLEIGCNELEFEAGTSCV
jgi:hypothetical protein